MYGELSGLGRVDLTGLGLSWLNHILAVHDIGMVTLFPPRVPSSSSPLSIAPLCEFHCPFFWGTSIFVCVCGDLSYSPTLCFAQCKFHSAKTGLG